VDGAIQIGLGHVNGVRRDEVEALVAAREARGGRFASLAELAAGAEAARPSLERLAWAGACDGLTGGDRRTALWELGVTATSEVLGGRRGAEAGPVQLALPLPVPETPPLRPLGDWDRMLADYSATGLTVATHPLGLLRPSLDAGVERAEALARLPHEHRVTVAGLVVARQRPGTANGIVFMLVEDETGTINLVVPPAVYERHRLTVRTEPLVLATGKLERHPAAGGGINVLVDRLTPLEAPDRPSAVIRDFNLLDERERARRLAEGAPGEGAGGEEEADEADFRAVAPAVMSFGSGRRR